MAHVKQVGKWKYIYWRNPETKKEECLGKYSPEALAEANLREFALKTQLKQKHKNRPEKEREEDERSLDPVIIYPGDPRVAKWLKNPNEIDIIGIDTQIGMVEDAITRLKEEIEEIDKEIKRYEGEGVEEDLIHSFKARMKNLELRKKRAEFLLDYPNTTSFIVMNQSHLEEVKEGKKKYPVEMGREPEGFAKLGIPPRHIYDLGVNYFNGDIKNFGAAASFTRVNEFHLTGQLTIPYYRGKRKPSKEEQMTIRHEVGHHVQLNTMQKTKKLKKLFKEWNEDVHLTSLKMNPQGASSIQTYGDDPLETFAERYCTFVSGDMHLTTEGYKSDLDTLKLQEEQSKLTKLDKMRKERLEEIVEASEEVIDFFNRTFNEIEEMDLTKVD
jgi:hypothetical protein